MPQQPARFPRMDGFEFAAAERVVRGAWPVSVLPRLGEELHDASGEVEYEVLGRRDAHGRLCLVLRASATLQSTCRQCLGAVECALHTEATLLLAPSQAQIDAQPLRPDGPEWIVAHKEMAVRDLVEDELLLALPYAPQHENCPARDSDATETRHTPFDALRGMLRGKNRH